MKTLYFNPGDIVFKAGSRSDCAYLIESGTFEVSCKNKYGEKRGDRKAHV